MADKVGAVIDSLPSPSGTGSMTGITTFIKENLLGGVKFCRKAERQKAKPQKDVYARGLAIGRAIDTAFNRHVDGTEKFSASKFRHARLGHVLGVLRARGIHPLKSQVLVCRPDLRLKTTIDALGNRAGELVVIELKSTQFARERHIRLYDQPCVSRPKLANGISASEKQMHLLQAAFGVISCRRHTSLKVSGVVVISYAHSARLVHVPEELCNAVLFATRNLHSPVGCIARPKRAKLQQQQFWPWPSSDERVMRVVKSHGADQIQAAADNVIVAKNGDEIIFVAGCIRQSLTKLKMSNRKQLTKVLLKIDRDIFRQQRSQAYILAPHGHFWRLHRIQ